MWGKLTLKGHSGGERESRSIVIVKNRKLERQFQSHGGGQKEFITKNESCFGKNEEELKFTRPGRQAFV